MISYVVIGILSVLVIVLSYFCVKFGILILRIQDAVEESLDTLDESHFKITEILARPLFYDSSEVRGVLREIEYSKNSIHKIAKSLTDNFEEGIENEG